MLNHLRFFKKELQRVNPAGKDVALHSAKKYTEVHLNLLL